MHIEQDKDNFLKKIVDNQGIIIKICNSYCSNKSDREDLAQEIIYALLKGNKTFNPDFKFSTWMYRVALNVAISFYRVTKKLNHTISYTESYIEMEDSIIDNSFEKEKINLLQLQIANLKELDRALIILYFEEKSYKEIAEIIGITETNVATKINRIKEKIKHAINNSNK